MVTHDLGCPELLRENRDERGARLGNAHDFTAWIIDIKWKMSDLHHHAAAKKADADRGCHKNRGERYRACISRQKQDRAISDRKLALF